MNIEEVREYCLHKAGVTEGFPFGEETLVFKVGGKMFLLAGLDDPSTVNLKCDPERAVERRERYPEVVMSGYHMNKKHWNTVTIDGPVPDDELRRWIDESYDLVVAGLPERVRLTIEEQGFEI